MSVELDFKSADFKALSQQQQVAKCREMAREAERLASNGNDEFRNEYSDLAARQSALADEIAQTQGFLPIGSIGRRAHRPPKPFDSLRIELLTSRQHRLFRGRLASLLLRAPALGPNEMGLDPFSDVIGRGTTEDREMVRGLGLWALGVPISIIILIALFTNFI